MNAPTPPPMLQAVNVSKWFGDVVAVSDVSFSVGAGVTALLGPNGAGKSTVLRMLCGLASPSNGSVNVLGKDPKTDIGVLANIGMAPQHELLFEGLTGLEFVTAAARLYGVQDPAAAARHSIDLVELDPDNQRPLSSYSKGMRQRIKLAQAVVHDPQIIVLDEPLTGLDPRQRRSMIQLFFRLGEQGRCVIVSSHVLEEVQQFGSQVLVMTQGRLAAQGDFHEIRTLMDDRPLRLRLRTDQPRRLAEGLLRAEVIAGLQLEGDDTIVVNTTDATGFYRAVAVTARRQQASLYELEPLDADLESVFRYLVQR